jgi:hypothetical protein
MAMSALHAAPSHSAADPQQGAPRTSEVRATDFALRRPHNGFLGALLVDAQALLEHAHSSCSSIL